jgi:hypothetical protein
MNLIPTCPGEHCSTVGVDAAPLEQYVSIDTGDGESILYDREEDDAWIQSDVYFPRETLV